jgi:hypothetical protein
MLQVNLVTRVLLPTNIVINRPFNQERETVVVFVASILTLPLEEVQALTS